MAERILQQATTRFPVDPAAFLQYATAAERQNHPEPARRALIQYGSLVVDEDGLVPRAARIAALSLKLNDPATAVDWLQRASAVSANDTRLLGLLADAQIKAGDRSGAASTIAGGLDKDPRNTTLLGLRKRLR